MVSEQPKICIIGAGFAGLRAARHFEQLGLDYLVLEGSNRVGGRVYPLKYQNGYLHHGAEYVNGTDNEIYEIVEKLDLLNKFQPRTNDLWMLDEETITVVDGEKVDEEILKMFHQFIRTLNENLHYCSEKESMKSVEEKVDEYLRKYLEEKNFTEKNVFTKLCGIYKNYFQTEWSSPIEKLSMFNFSLWDDGTDEEDSAVLNKLGFQKILEKLKSYIPEERICLNSKVINISYDMGCQVVLESGDQLQFDSIVVTCSLGFLKAHHKTMFTPNLPQEKQDAIEQMGFGANLKVFLEYERPWWPQTTSTIVISSVGEAENFMVFQPSSWAENVLVCWIAGSGPQLISQLYGIQLKLLLDNHLKDNLKFLFVPNASRILYKNWMNDEFALGSYSYLTAGQEEHDMRILGEPIVNGEGRPIICFAGEHTDQKMYQTTVGAVKSGLREALRISNEICK